MYVNNIDTSPLVALAIKNFFFDMSSELQMICYSSPRKSIKRFSIQGNNNSFCTLYTDIFLLYLGWRRTRRVTLSWQITSYMQFHFFSVMSSKRIKLHTYIDVLKLLNNEENKICFCVCVYVFTTKSNDCNKGSTKLNIIPSFPFCLKCSE